MIQRKNTDSDVSYTTFVSVSKINMYRIAIFNQQMIPGRESYILWWKLEADSEWLKLIGATYKNQQEEM